VKRRDLITLLGGAAALPLTARAQQLPRRPTIGFLGTNATVWAPWTAAFVERLRALGWVEGRTVAIEYRSRLRFAALHLRHGSRPRRCPQLGADRKHLLGLRFTGPDPYAT
jgi:hypothetical protein